MSEFYYQDNAGITGWRITREKAEQLLAEHAVGCDLHGDLEAGFTYTPRCELLMAPPVSIGLFPVRVTPLPDVDAHGTAQ